MKKVTRLIFCDSFNHESLFDLDYENAYSLHGFRELFNVLSQKETCTPPVISFQEMVICHKRCDEVLLLLMFKEKKALCASDKIATIEFATRFLKVCKDFLGTLSVENVLANVTLLAEIVDCVLIGGFVHLTSTAKIRGFLSQAYVLPTSTTGKHLPHHHQPSAIKLTRLTGSGHQPEGQNKVVSTSQSTAVPAKEHLYVDWIETLDFNINQSGETTCSIHGVLNTNNVTGGQKMVDFHINKSYSKIIGQHSFNKCIDSSKFNTSGQLKADVSIGQTQLLTYHLTSTDPPFVIEAVKGTSPGEVIITLQCTVPAAVMCLNVTAAIALNSKSRGLLKLSSMTKHTLELNDDKRTINWNIPEIAGHTCSTVHFKILPDGHVDIDLSKTMLVTFKFEISNYLHSTCKISSIKVQHSKPVTKWIRHLTVAGDCRSHLLVECS